MLYKVNCGRDRGEQVIHCDRMKAFKTQTLRNEISENDEEREYTDDPSPGSEDESSQAKCKDVDLKSSLLETVEDLAPDGRSVTSVQWRRWNSAQLLMSRVLFFS